MEAVFLSILIAISCSSCEGFIVPIDATSSVTCLIPGLRDLICAGNRLAFGERTPGAKGLGYFGYKNGADLRLLNDIPKQPGGIRNSQSGSGYGVNFGQNGIDFGTHSGLFGVLGKHEGGRFEVSKNGNYRLGLGERNGLLGNLLTFGNMHGVEVNPRNLRTRISRRRTLIPGILEERQNVNLDPTAFNFGSQKQTCLFGICFNTA